MGNKEKIKNENKKPKLIAQLKSVSEWHSHKWASFLLDISLTVYLLVSCTSVFLEKTSILILTMASLFDRTNSRTPLVLQCKTREKLFNKKNYNHWQLLPAFPLINL